MSNRYSIYPASFVHGGGTLNLAQMRSQQVQTAVQKAIIQPGGSLDPAAVFTAGANPKIPITSRDLTTILGTVSPTAGLNCSSGATLRFQLHSDQAGFASGTSHVTFVSTLGFLNLMSIEAEVESEEGAQASLEYTPLFDGTNEPVVSNNSVNFATAPSPSFTSLFFHGDVYLGTTQLPSVIRTAVNFGVNFAPRRTDSNTWPTEGVIKSRRPAIELTFLKIGMIPTTIQSLFGAAYGSTLNVMFRAAESGTASGREPIGDEEHVKVASSAGDWTPDDVSVADENDATFTLMVRPTGTLSVSTGSAYPS